MKKIIILLFFFKYSFAQKLQNIIQSDTIYIEFRESENLKKDIKKIKDTLVTVYSLDFLKQKNVGLIRFFFPKVEFIDGKKKVITEITYENRSFLKKNKLIIINEKFLLKKDNLKKIKEIFRPNNMINFFVIEKAKDMKIAIYPVKSMLRELKPSIE